MRMLLNHQKFQSAVLAALFVLVVAVLMMTKAQELEITRVSRSLMTAPNVPQTEPRDGLLPAFQEFLRSKDKRAATVEAAPAGMTELARIQVDNCPPDPDGVCGYSLYVYGPVRWEAPGTHAFYLAETAGGPLSFYGPYEGDLKLIVAEAQYVKALTELR